MIKFFKTVEQYLTAKTVPAYEELFSLFNQVSDFLETEITEYRPVADSGFSGSLIELKDDLPALIIPDIHARPDFILNILNYKLPAEFTGTKRRITVASALERGLVNVICVGDAIHSELDSNHWKEIEKEYEKKNFSGPSISKEMTNCFAVLTAIMKLKLLCPVHFHFLKGNHENILNQNGNGDYAFCKYSDEGNIVKNFIRHFYGDDILFLISCYENALPLIVAGKNYVVSHAEPKEIYSKNQLINARNDSAVVEGLIWTKNDTVENETVMPILKTLVNPDYAERSFYFAGHRPVKGLYSLRQGGRFVQIHNPWRQNIVLVYNNKIFNPDKDIVGVENE